MLERNAVLPERPDWSSAQRVGFRFAFLYFGLYILPFPLVLVPGMRGLVLLWLELWKAIVLWVGEHVLGIAHPIRTDFTGSGDRLFDWIQILCFLAVALVGTAIWSALSRAKHHRRLAGGSRVLVRYYLATMLLIYGFTKLWKVQFPLPDPVRLLEPYGESSPMGLLWTFMGASTAYTVLAGLAESVSGFLLFFRRTTLAGAILILGVMGQVVVLNLCYDVPVKQFAFHLWLLAALLAAPDLGRVWDVVVRGRPVPAAAPLEKHPSDTRVLKGIVVVLLVGWLAADAARSYHRWGDGRPLSPVAGLYEVESGKPWRRVAIGAWAVGIRGADEKTTYYRLVAWEGDGLRLADGPRSARLTLRDGVLSGDFFGEAIRVRLRPADESATLLLRRGFHWISEEPFNR